MTNNKNPNWYAPVSVISGLVFLFFILIAAIFIPEPSSFQIFVFRVVIALAAASFGATIPGFLNANLPVWGKGAIAAGGALALFVIIFNINPPQILTTNNNVETIVPYHEINIDETDHANKDYGECSANNTNIEGLIFDNSKLHGCDFQETIINRAKFKGANVSTADFREVEGFRVSFENASALFAKFTLATLHGANFRGANLTEAEFWGADLREADFTEADMEGAYLAGADITGADFTNVKNLTQEQVNLTIYDPSFHRSIKLPPHLTGPIHTKKTVEDLVGANFLSN